MRGLAVTEPPPRIAGFAELRRWLRTVGVAVIRRPVGYFKESGFPFQPGSSGRIVFTRNDIKKWVELCTGYEYAAWVTRWEGSDKTGMCVFDPMRQAPPSEPQTLLYAAIYRVVEVAPDGSTQSVEAVVRRADGFPYVAHGRSAARRWPTEIREYAEVVAEFSVARRTEDADFAAAPELAASLIVPKIMRGGEARYLLAPGNVFGLHRAARCPVVAPGGWRGWPPLRSTIDRKFPDAIWTTWTGRTDMDRFLLTPKGLSDAPPADPEAPTRAGEPVTG